MNLHDDFEDNKLGWYRNASLIATGLAILFLVFMVLCCKKLGKKGEELATCQVESDSVKVANIALGSSLNRMTAGYNALEGDRQRISAAAIAGAAAMARQLAEVKATVKANSQQQRQKDLIKDYVAEGLLDGKYLIDTLNVKPGQVLVDTNYVIAADNTSKWKNIYKAKLDTAQAAVLTLTGSLGMTKDSLASCRISNQLSIAALLEGVNTFTLEAQTSRLLGLGRKPAMRRGGAKLLDLAKGLKK